MQSHPKFQDLRKWGAVLTTLTLGASNLPTATAQNFGASYRLVAFSGQSAPGGGRYSSLGTPRLAANGAVVFYSSLQGKSSGGLFFGQPNDLQLSSLSDGTFDVNSVSISQSGAPAFVGSHSIPPSGSSETGIFTSASGSPVLALALGNSDFSVFSFRPGYPAIKVPAGALGNGLPATSSLLIGPVSNPQVAMAVGDDAPGFGATAKIDQVFVFSQGGTNAVDLSENGDAALTVSVNPKPSQTPPPLAAIYAGHKNAWQLVAAEGGAAPGVADAIYTGLTDTPSIASNSFFAFQAYVYRNRSNGSISAAFAGQIGRIPHLIVKNGDSVPGSQGTVFDSILNAVINETGDVVFPATIRYTNGGTRSGIWIQRRTGHPVLLAVDGITLDTPTGRQKVTSVDFAGPGTFNDLHEVVFRASFADGSTGIYIADTRPVAPFVRATFPRKPRNRVTRDKSITITGTASDETGVKKVEYTVRHLGSAQKKNKNRALSRLLVREAKGDRRWSFKVPLALGVSRISVTATDRLGNVSEQLILAIRRY